MATLSPGTVRGLRSVGWWCACTALPMLVHGIAFAAPLAERVPANAIAYLSTPDASQLEQTWFATGLGRLWQADKLADFREAFHKATRLSSDGDVSLLGISWAELKSIASGEACWALAPVKDDVGFVLLVDIAKNAAAAEKLVANLRKLAPSRTYTISDGVLCISNRAELAKTPAESLASSQAYQAIAKRTPSATAQLRWFVDPWEFQPIASDPNYWKQLAENGFDVIEAVGGAMTFASSAQDVEHLWSVYAPGKRKKAARLLSFSPLEDWKLPKWIPADVDSVLSIQWNLTDALPGCGSLFDEVYVEGEKGTFDAILDDFKEEPTGPKVDIPELLKLQHGPVLMLTKTLADGSTPSIYAVRVTDEKKVAEALERMLAPDEGVDPKKVGKFTMWVFKELKAGAGPAMGPNLAGYALAAAHGYLFVATSAPALEPIIAAAPGPKLIDDKTFARLDEQAQDRRIKDSVGWRVSPAAGGLPPLYEGIRARGEIDLGRLLGDPENDQHRLDCKKLPAGAILPDFFAPGLGLINQIEVGWQFEGLIEKGGK